MGSSTRNLYKRTSRIIEKGKSNGIVTNTGKGIGKLISDMIFPTKGVSKVKRELQDNLYSHKISECFKNINIISKAYNSDSLSSIGLGGILSLSGIEQKEFLCDYLNINDTEILKTSFKESLDEKNIFDNKINILNFISLFIKNIIENIYKKYTFEDCINQLPEFNSTDYNNDLNSYMNSNVYPIIIDGMGKLEFETENNFDLKVQNTMTSIINKLRKVGV